MWSNHIEIERKKKKKKMIVEKEIRVLSPNFTSKIPLTKPADSLQLLQAYKLRIRATINFKCPANWISREIVLDEAVYRNYSFTNCRVYAFSHPREFEMEKRSEHNAWNLLLNFRDRSFRKFRPACTETWSSKLFYSSTKVTTSISMEKLLFIERGDPCLNWDAWWNLTSTFKSYVSFFEMMTRQSKYF